MSDLMASAPSAGPARADRTPRAFDPTDVWPAPDARLLNGGPRKAPVFPVEALGAIAPWVCNLAAAKRAPVDYVAAPLLAFTAGVVGAARDVRIEDGWREPLILWVASVGNPSSGKSPPLATLKRAVLAMERTEGADLGERRREYEAKRVEAEAVRTHWETAVKDAVKKGSKTPLRPEMADDPEEPYAPRLLAADATREAAARLLVKHPRGLLLALDELAGLIGNFGKYGGADEPFYLAAYGGDFSPVDRVKGDTLTADRAYLSIVGAIQPDRIHALLSGRADDGLVSRFLPVWPDPPPQWLREVPAGDEVFAEALFARLRSLRMGDSDGDLRPRELKLSPDARDIFFAWCAEQHAKTNEAHGFMAGFLGKSKGTCARVALALELLDWAATTAGAPDGPEAISADAMERACILFADYFEPMARRVYADAALPEDERTAVALLKEIRQRGVRRFNARTAQREWGVPNLSTAAAMSAACTLLVEGDCVREVGREPGSGPGRKAKDYFVNPRLLREVAP